MTKIEKRSVTRAVLRTRKQTSIILYSDYILIVLLYYIAGALAFVALCIGYYDGTSNVPTYRQSVVEYVYVRTYHSKNKS